MNLVIPNFTLICSRRVLSGIFGNLGAVVRHLAELELKLVSVFVSLVKLAIRDAWGPASKVEHARFQQFVQLGQNGEIFQIAGTLLLCS